MNKIRLPLMFFTIGLFFLSCTNLVDESKRNSYGNEASEKTRIKITLSPPDERTVFPSYDVNTLTDIVLTGKKTTKTEYIELKKWDSYTDLEANDGIIVDDEGDKISSTWDFKLTAKSLGATLSGDCRVTIKENDSNTVGFNLAVDSASADSGAVNIAIDVKSLAFDKLTATFGVDGKEENVDLTGASIVFSKNGVSKGSHRLVLKFYKGETVVYTYSAYVIVQPGASSNAAINDETIAKTAELLVVSIVYDYNNKSGNSEPTSYSLSSTIMGGDDFISMTAPTGKKFRGWNTKSDGTGTAYSKGDNPNLTENITLYAQWCSYDSENSIYAIKDESDLRAFFSYNGKSGEEVGQSDNARLDTDFTSLKNWIPNIFKGVFDGNENTITGLEMASPDFETAGFIGDLAGGEVKNLKITNSTISTSSEKGYAGAIAGKISDSSAKITGCTTYKISVNAVYAGSIAGYNAGMIENAYVEGGAENAVVIGNAEYTEAFAGGIVGINAGTVSYAKVDGIKITNKVSIVGNDASENFEGANLGGIAGKNETGAMISNPILSTITVSDQNGYAFRVAGVVGWNFGDVKGAKITNSTITGSETYAYVNEIAVGVNGTVSDVSSENDGNTVTGKNSVIINKYCTISNSSTENVGYFTTVNRNVNAKVTVVAKKNDGSKGGAITPFLKKESTDVLESEKVASGSKITKIVEKLTAKTKYTVQLKNENVFNTHYATVTVEVE